MGACCADERLRPLLTLNVSCSTADDRFISHLSHHFEVSEVGMLARCLCVPLVSLSVGKVQRHGALLCPTTTSYWRSHPMEIWSAIAGRFPSSSSSMGHFFGVPGAGAPGGPNDMSIQDALANTRTDGAGALLREGAAALLNSLTRAGFPYTTDQVHDAFAAAAAGGSDGAAAAQAAAFNKANEGRA